MSETYKVKLTGPGISIEKEVPEQVAHKIAFAVLGPIQGGGKLAAPAGGATEEGADDSDPSSPGESAREYLLHYAARRIPEQIATLAYFMKKSRKSDLWNRKELVAAFEEAKEAVPKNLSRDINWTIKIGWIAPKSGQEDTFYLTGPGIKAVETKFPDELRKKTKVSRGGRKSKTKAKA